MRCGIVRYTFNDYWPVLWPKGNGDVRPGEISEDASTSEHPRDTELDAHFGANHNAAFRDKNCKNGAAREENCVPDTASGLK